MFLPYRTHQQCGSKNWVLSFYWTSINFHSFFPFLHIFIFIISTILKPCQNKTGQSFVVMLGFFMSFFEFASAACCKKKDMQKPSITTNVWSFLFCHRFSSLTSFFIFETPRHSKSVESPLFFYFFTIWCSRLRENNELFCRSLEHQIVTKMFSPSNPTFLSRHTDSFD